MPGSFAEFPLASDKFHLHCAHMGQFLQDRENGQNVAFFLFFETLVAKRFVFFSTFLNCVEEIFYLGF